MPRSLASSCIIFLHHLLASSSCSIFLQHLLLRGEESADLSPACVGARQRGSNKHENHHHRHLLLRGNQRGQLLVQAGAEAECWGRGVEFNRTQSFVILDHTHTVVVIRGGGSHRSHRPRRWGAAAAACRCAAAASASKHHGSLLKGSLAVLQRGASCPGGPRWAPSREQPAGCCCGAPASPPPAKGSVLEEKGSGNALPLRRRAVDSKSSFTCRSPPPTTCSSTFMVDGRIMPAGCGWNPPVGAPWTRPCGMANLSGASAAVAAHGTSGHCCSTASKDAVLAKKGSGMHTREAVSHLLLLPRPRRRLGG